MEFVTTGERAVFADDVIKNRGLIRAKHFTWEEPRNGLIVYAGKEFLRVIFLTGVNTSASYFNIKASEVAAGQWDIAFTSDMENVCLIRSKSSSDLVSEVRKLFKNEEGITSNGTG